MLNTYFETIVPLLEASRGEVHQIVGDEVITMFNKQALPIVPKQQPRGAPPARRRRRPWLRHHGDGFPDHHLDSNVPFAAVSGRHPRAPKARRSSATPSTSRRGSRPPPSARS